MNQKLRQNGYPLGQLNFKRFIVLVFVSLSFVVSQTGRAQDEAYQEAYLSLSDPLATIRSKSYFLRFSAGTAIANPVYQAFEFSGSVEKNISRYLSMGPQIDFYRTSVDPVVEAINERVKDLGSFNTDTPKASVRLRTSFPLVAGLSNFFESSVKSFDVSIFGGPGLKMMVQSGLRPEVFGGASLSWALGSAWALETQFEVSSTFKRNQGIGPDEAVADSLLKIGLAFGFN